MRILFLHVNFPAQFKHLAPALQQRGHDLRALTMSKSSKADFPVLHHVAERDNAPGLDPLLVELDTKLIRGRSALSALQHLGTGGWQPDLVIGHMGWGDALFVRDLWPQARQLGLFEFFYHATGQDIGFDTEFPDDPLQCARVRQKNLWLLGMLESVDLGYCPTVYQRDVHPIAYHHKLRVVHEGIDTTTLCPNPQAHMMLGSGHALTPAEEIVTFVNRDLEPYRGYHIFMRALPEIQRRRPHARVLIVGGSGASYGTEPTDGQSWRQIFLEEVRDRLDLSRVHFLGRIPYSQFVALLQMSQVHVYLTYPFVLSWSMLEAMSCGALVIGSNTAPVREVIEDGYNGLLVDFFDSEGLVRRIDEVFTHPDRMQALRQRARQTVVERYDLRSVCLPRQLALIDEVMQ